METHTIRGKLHMVMEVTMVDTMDTLQNPNVKNMCHKIPEHKSHKVPRPVCKTVVDTTYIEECEDIVTEHCEEVHQQVHHSSQVVGHDSQVIHGGHGGHYGKRD